MIAKFEEAPCGHENFAARHGLNVGTFRIWLYRLRSERGDLAQGPGDAAGFVEVVRGAAALPIRSGLGCAVRIGEVEVMLTQTPAPGFLAELVRELAR